MKKVSCRLVLFFPLLTSCLFLFNSCTSVDVFEKNMAIPMQSWSSPYKPEITFEIQDTNARYNIYLVLRHTDAYRYKNIWININIQPPAGTSRNYPLDLKLATDEKGWLGSGMDDIFEHRILITPPQHPEQLVAGIYHFKLENIMREDPLDHIMNVGIRLEKVK